MPGRHFLQIPGPTNIPDRVTRAMEAGLINHRGDDMPPLLRSMGLRRKLRLGPWFTPALRALRSMRGLRGTRLDPFGRAEVRRRERALPGWYRDQVTRALSRLDDGNAGLVRDVARLPDEIRGYEDIKLRAIERAERQAELLLRQIEGGARPLPVVG
jgi:indolepyruvate ferredoxin oxidoreductase